MRDLETIIREGQDRVRGRPRNWKDDVADWWRDFSFDDLMFRVWAIFAALYLTVMMPLAITAIVMIIVKALR